MTDSRRICMIVYPGFELLDLAGPTGVFNAANTLSERAIYHISVVSAEGGNILSSCGIPVATSALDASGDIGSDTTVLVVGAEGRNLTQGMKCQRTLSFLKDAFKTAGRCGSVCSGAFILAASGILNGKRAATHWAGEGAFSRWFPDVHLDREALYVVDDLIWTSAGVTTGIDMALAMVETDCGKGLKGRVSGHLVVHSHRPGFQTQFSSVLQAQIKAGDPFGDVIHWANANLGKQISVEELAERAGMTTRSFQRKFKAITGETPARFLVVLRMERARELLASEQQVKQVAAQVGFASETAFRSAFKDHFGVSPSQLAATQQ
ncbi:MAG: GlxA family transcriptional regulator [Litoreibacter sp.]|nr:GlxA family transcriptional regulator [Litoreibacter sp.]